MSSRLVNKVTVVTSSGAVVQFRVSLMIRMSKVLSYLKADGYIADDPALVLTRTDLSCCSDSIVHNPTAELVAAVRTPHLFSRVSTKHTMLENTLWAGCIVVVLVDGLGPSDCVRREMARPVPIVEGKEADVSSPGFTSVEDLLKHRDQFTMLTNEEIEARWTLPSAPTFMRFRKGVHYQCKCDNPECVTFGERVIVNMGMGKRRPVEDFLVSRSVRCPACSKRLSQARSFGVSGCRVVWKGVTSGGVRREYSATVPPYQLLTVKGDDCTYDDTTNPIGWVALVVSSTKLDAYRVSRNSSSEMDRSARW